MMPSHQADMSDRTPDGLSRLAVVVAVLSLHLGILWSLHHHSSQAQAPRTIVAEILSEALPRQAALAPPVPMPTSQAAVSAKERPAPSSLSAPVPLPPPEENTVKPTPGDARPATLPLSVPPALAAATLTTPGATAPAVANTAPPLAAKRTDTGQASASTASALPPPARPGVATPLSESAAQSAPEKLELPFADAQHLSNTRPPYPALSKRLGEQGRVVVNVLIGVDGMAQKVELLQSSGYDRLDQSALATALRWRYVPGKRGGVAQPMWFGVPINFVIE